MKYAVVGRFYDDGRVKAEVRPARPEDQEGCKVNEDHDEYIDIFETEKKAYIFAAGHTKA